MEMVIDIYFPNTDWNWGYIDVNISVNDGNNNIGVYWSRLIFGGLS